MNDIKTPVTETDNNENQKELSDARIILGPLVKYAAMGLVLVSIIITTAVMLDRQFNDIDREVAELEAQLAQARLNTSDQLVTDNSAELKAEPVLAVEAVTPPQKQVNSEVAKVTAVEMPVTNVVENNIDTAPAATQQTIQLTITEPSVTETTAVAEPATETTAAEVAVTENAVVRKVNTPSDFFDKSIDQLMAERATYLKEMDRVYLEEFKASQQKQLQFMRERLVRQERRIEEMEKRNQERYDIRAADMKEMQERREYFLNDRI